MAVKKKITKSKPKKPPRRYDHKRNLFQNKRFKFQQKINKNQLQPGMIVTFAYKGMNVHDPQPLVLVLNKYWLGKLHGINLNYCKPSQVNAIAKIVSEKIDAKQEKLGQKYNITNPYGFYHTSIKGAIAKFGKSVYRTYFFSGVMQPKLLDFKFEKSQGKQVLVFTDKQGKTQVQVTKIKSREAKRVTKKKPQDIQQKVSLTRKQKNVKVIPSTQLTSAKGISKTNQVKTVSNVSTPIVTNVKEK